MAVGEALPKKLINFGWDMLTPAALAEKIGEFQQLPSADNGENRDRRRRKGRQAGWDDISSALFVCDRDRARGGSRRL